MYTVTSGDEIDKIRIWQQDIDNYCLMANHPDSSYLPNQAMENLIELTIEFHKNDPRFFIEVFLKRLSTFNTTFALSKLSLEYNQSCLNEKNNNCVPTNEQNSFQNDEP